MSFPRLSAQIILCPLLMLLIFIGGIATVGQDLLALPGNAPKANFGKYCPNADDVVSEEKDVHHLPVGHRHRHQITYRTAVAVVPPPKPAATIVHFVASKSLRLLASDQTYYYEFHQEITPPPPKKEC